MTYTVIAATVAVLLIYVDNDPTPPFSLAAVVDYTCAFLLFSAIVFLLLLAAGYGIKGIEKLTSGKTK